MIIVTTTRKYCIASVLQEHLSGIIEKPPMGPTDKEQMSADIGLKTLRVACCQSNARELKDLNILVWERGKRLGEGARVKLHLIIM